MKKPTKHKPKSATSAQKANSGKAGTLSADDHRIWKQVAASVLPDPNAKGRLMQGSGFQALESALGDDQAASALFGMPARETTTQPPRPDTKSKRTRSPTHHPQKDRIPGQATAGPHPPPIETLDPNELRKVRGGRMRIEARLDLHGMRQHEAHSELRRFLLRCQVDGARWVLVITGKGARSFDADSQAFDSWPTRSSPGVLREKVPLWLREPDLHAVVAGFNAASARHGGDGALYIRLRSRRR